MTLLKVIVPGCLEQDSEVEMFQSGRTEQFGLRGRLSGSPSPHAPPVRIDSSERSRLLAVFYRPFPLVLVTEYHWLAHPCEAQLWTLLMYSGLDQMVPSSGLAAPIHCLQLSK